MIRGLVLDVDDTLYLERSYVRSGFRHLESWCVRELGVIGVGARAWALFETGVRHTTITDALLESGVTLTADLRRRSIAAYREHQPQIELLDDAARLIRAAGGSIPISIVTDGPPESQRAKCAALGLFDLADPVIITAEMGSSKPDPAVFIAASASWDIPANALAYVADNPSKDFEGPQLLGWQCVRIRRPGGLHECVNSPEGVADISSLDEILPMLNRPKPMSQ